MKELDNYSLDQKSWAFLNLIGQTPQQFLTNMLHVMGGTFTATSNGNGFAYADTTNGLILYGQGSVTDFGLLNKNGNSIFTVLTGSTRADFSGQVTAANKIYPGTDAAAQQTAAGIYAGTGAPNNANGANGDVYIRSDGGALTTIYQRRAGAWVGIV